MLEVCSILMASGQKRTIRVIRGLVPTSLAGSSQSEAMPKTRCLPEEINTGSVPNREAINIKKKEKKRKRDL
jgi:hypothetical protein